MKITRRTPRAEIPSMAMGDIAFNLIIFFVILARAQDDSHVRWTPTRAANVENPAPARVSVAIDVDNNRYLNGQPIGLSQLTGRIEELLRGVEADERVVQFKVHRDATTMVLEPTAEAIAKAGADVFVVVEEETQ